MRFAGKTVRGIAIGVTVLLGVTLAGPVTQAVPPPGVASRAQTPGADGWRVDRVSGGYRLTLRLAAPLRMRDALPWLAVDGRPLGVARESADRRTLTLVTRDPRAATAREVGVVWSQSAQRPPDPRSPESSVPLRTRGPVLPLDSGSAGRFAVDTAEYDLGDQAVALSGLGRRAELRGRVYSPRGARGPRPMVVFLHGRHTACYGQEPDPPAVLPWPCPAPMKPVPSYRGYDAPARALAGHGYHVISISANAINAWDSRAFDYGALARAQLVLAHLDRWRRWSVLGGGPFGRRFVGRVDLRNIGLMGHSRGGDGVVRAALLNAERRSPYGVRAVLPLAPTDFARPTLPGVAMSVLLPYCDGDVDDLQGQHFYDDTRYAAADQAHRSSVLVMGANHNFFNTEWTPGQSVAPSWDDWNDEAPTRGPCGARHAARLKAIEQQAVGRAYIAGFFRLVLGGETGLHPLFDGSDSRAASAGRATVRVVAQVPARDRLDLARFDRALPAGSTAGGVTARVCAGSPGVDAPTAAGSPGRPRDGTGVPLCTTLAQPWRLPHWTPAVFAPKAPTTAVTAVRWTGPTGVVRITVPPGRRDVRRYAALTLRAAPDPATRGALDLTVRVVDGRGRFADVAVSAVSDALVPLPGVSADGLPKTLLRTVRIPLRSLGRVNLRDIRSVELRTDRVRSGAVFVSDLAFSRPSLGNSGPTGLPRLSVNDVRTREGDTVPRAATFTVTLSRPSRVPVSVHFTTLWDPEDRHLVPVHRRLTFAPGQTRVRVGVPIRANTRDSDDEQFSVVLSVPHDAVVADAFGNGVVLDDDPSPTVTMGDAVAVENGESIRFPIRSSAPSDRWIGVLADLVDGTAVLGRDHRSPYDDGEGEPERFADGYLEPGQTTGWMELVVLDDRIREGPETFTARITEVDSAIPNGPRVLTGTIRDDD